jgi:hypothetical protein
MPAGPTHAARLKNPRFPFFSQNPVAFWYTGFFYRACAAWMGLHFFEKRKENA